MRAAVIYGVLLGFSLALHTETSRAEAQPPLTLDWLAPPGCPTRDDVLAGVGRILGRSASAVRQPVAARATVSPLSANEWQVDLSTRAAESEGVRSVRAPTCRAAAETTALILALAIDPDSQPEATPIAPPATAPASPSTLGANPANAAASPNGPSTSKGPTLAPQVRTGQGAASAPVGAEARVRAPPPEAPSGAASPFLPHLVGVSAEAAAGVGILPSPALGVEGAIALRPKRYRLEAGAVYWFPQSPALTATGGSASFMLVSPFLRGGFAFERGRWELVPYLAVDGYVMAASAKGFSASTSTTAPWIALGPDVMVGVRVTRALAFRLGGEVSFPLGEPKFVVTGGPTAFRPSPVSGRGTLGVEVRFL